MPGFGLSDPIADHPAVGAVDSVLRFMDSLGVERADLIGNSFGGFIGSMLAMEHPSRLRRLVTVGGVGRNIFSPTPAEGVKIITDFVENPSRELLVRWLHSMVYDPALVTDELIEERWKQANDPATLACIRAMYGRGAGAGLYDAADDGPPPLWAQLHKIKAPTLLTWGRDDRVTPLDGALLPVRTIPDVELHVFPNCGHWVMIEAAGVPDQDRVQELELIRRLALDARDAATVDLVPRDGRVDERQVEVPAGADGTARVDPRALSARSGPCWGTDAVTGGDQVRTRRALGAGGGAATSVE